MQPSAMACWVSFITGALPGAPFGTSRIRKLGPAFIALKRITLAREEGAQHKGARVGRLDHSLASISTMTLAPSFT